MFLVNYNAEVMDNGNADSAHSVKQEINVLERIWKKEFVAYSRVLSRHFPGRTGEKKQMYQSVARRQSRRVSAEQKSEALPLGSSCWPRLSKIIF
jgi:hypothetical protein